MKQSVACGVKSLLLVYPALLALVMKQSVACGVKSMLLVYPALLASRLTAVM